MRTRSRANQRGLTCKISSCYQKTWFSAQTSISRSASGSHPEQLDNFRRRGRAETGLDGVSVPVFLREFFKVAWVRLNQQSGPSALPLVVQRVGECLPVKGAALHEEPGALVAKESIYHSLLSVLGEPAASRVCEVVWGTTGPKQHPAADNFNLRQIVLRHLEAACRPDRMTLSTDALANSSSSIVRKSMQVPDPWVYRRVGHQAHGQWSSRLQG